IGKQTALILKVHRSNFFMSGFVESPATAEISTLARKKRVPFVEDLGSGAMSATEQIGLHHHEPTPVEVLKDGADLVCFSGDKLFGGPQAGIIVGKKRLIAALKSEPLFRALRCDKLVFAALQTTVDLHLNQVTSEIPALALLQIPKDELRARAAAMVTRLQGLPVKITIGSATSKIGGGTLPRSILPSITLDFCQRTARSRILRAYFAILFRPSLVTSGIDGSNSISARFFRTRTIWSSTPFALRAPFDETFYSLDPSSRRSRQERAHQTAVWHRSRSFTGRISSRTLDRFRVLRTKRH